jgi:hypothetical protein
VPYGAGIAAGSEDSLALAGVTRVTAGGLCSKRIVERFTAGEGCLPRLAGALAAGRTWGAKRARLQDLWP